MPPSQARAVPPANDEYATPYAGYVARVPSGDIVTTIRTQLPATLSLLRAVEPARTLTAYAPGKWSIRDIVQHMADTERVMSYRALRIARSDPTPLPGFDENAYAPAAGAGARSMESLLAEFETVRASTVALLDGFPSEAWERRGTASGTPVTVRALAWIIAGHERHHVAIIRERYLTD